LKGYKLNYSEPAKKFLSKCDKTLAKKIEEKLNQLTNGYQGLDIKKLKAYQESTYRLRVNNIRVLFNIINKELLVYVIEIDHRKSIYD